MSATPPPLESQPANDALTRQPAGDALPAEPAPVWNTWDDDEDDAGAGSEPRILDDYVHPARPVVIAARWTLIAFGAGLGWAVFSAAAAMGARAGWSYVAGLLIVVAMFEFGSYNVRFATRYLPNLTLPIAMTSYSLTVLALGLFYALSSPRVVDGTAAGVGIFVGVGVWLGTEIARNRVRSTGD